MLDLFIQSLVNVLNNVESVTKVHQHEKISSATMFLRYLRFFLILAINFYYVINKLIILVSDSH
jgi:hypothetical protein